MKINCPYCNTNIKKDAVINDKIELVCDLCGFGFSVNNKGAISTLIYHKMGRNIIWENGRERGYPSKIRPGDVLLKFK